MKSSIIEVVVGITVFIIVLSLLFFAGTKYLYSKDDVYCIYGECSNVEGIIVGSDIIVAGVKIGYVSSLELNKENFYVKINMRINKDITLPEDSYAAIATSGFIGNKYISIVPGVSEVTLKQGSIINISPPLNLNNLLGKIIYYLTNK